MLDKTIECDDCKEEVQVKDVKVKDIPIDNENNRDKRVWVCPNCNHEYLITITNKESRDISKLIERDAAELKTITNKAQWLANRNRMTKVQMNRNFKRTEDIGGRMKANRDRLDKLSRMLIDEYNKGVGTYE